MDSISAVVVVVIAGMILPSVVVVVWRWIELLRYKARLAHLGLKARIESGAIDEFVRQYEAAPSPLEAPLEAKAAKVERGFPVRIVKPGPEEEA